MSDLLKANKLINAGKYSEGITLLFQYLEIHPEDAEQSYRLAVIAEQVGTKEQAIVAYDNCLLRVKNNVLIYLYAGYFFLSIGEKQKGLAILSLGQDVDARLTSFYYASGEIDEQTKKRSYYADLALRTHFTELHKSTCTKSEKVQQAIWPQTYNKPFNYNEDEQQPHLFYLPDVSAKPFWPSDMFPSFGELESSFNDIKKEFLSLKKLLSELGVPYLGEQYKSQGFETLAGSDNWTALHLFKDGIEDKRVTKLLPVTLNALKKVPLYGLDEKPFEVFFSVLKPEQHITPHYGLSNHSLTIHLPIEVPGEGYLSVAGNKVQWQEGKLIAFDDSFIHEAENLGRDDRVVLIFSIWHPELNAKDKDDICRTFLAKESWLSNRNSYLPD